MDASKYVQACAPGIDNVPIKNNKQSSLKVSPPVEASILCNNLLSLMRRHFGRYSQLENNLKPFPKLLFRTTRNHGKSRCYTGFTSRMRQVTPFLSETRR